MSVRVIWKACPVCHAPEDAPCRHLTTGKDIVGHHAIREIAPYAESLNRTVAEIEGESDEEFWAWVDEYWKQVDADQYHGEF